MKKINKILAVLEKNKEVFKNRFKVKEIGVFGSYATGKEKANSDIDILVEFGERANLLDLTGLGSFLEKKLKVKVDIVSKKALRKELRKFVLKQVLYV